MTDVVTMTPNPAVDLSTSVERIIPVAKLRGTSHARSRRRRDQRGARHQAPGRRCQRDLSVGGATGDCCAGCLTGEASHAETFAIAEETREDFFVFEISTGQAYRLTSPVRG